MTDTPELATALAAFQADMPTVTKGKTADAGNYRYKYADLADVTQAAMPLLSRHGLAFTAEPDYANGGLILRGVLMHKSGESRVGVLPLAGGTPQALGSSITYMRRYLLGCLTGIVTDDDDDGQTAQAAQARPSRVPPAAARFRESREAPAETVPGPDEAPPERMSANTRRHLFALLHQKGISDDQQLRGINDRLGTTYRSRADVTEVDACQIIDYLSTLPDPVSP